MTLWQRIKSILAAVALFLTGALLVAVNEFDFHALADIEGMDPATAELIRTTDFSSLAYAIVLTILSVALLVQGIRMIIFYFTMAKHMTGGRFILYRGILLTDLGLFTMSLQNVPVTYIMVYLIGLLAFSGAVDVFGAVDARKIHAHWKMRFIRGAVTIIFAVYALLNLNTPKYCVYIYSASLFYNAMMYLISAFRRTELIMIQ